MSRVLYSSGPINHQEEGKEQKMGISHDMRTIAEGIICSFDVAGVMFAVIDADEIVSFINRKGCDILGYQQEEIIGKNWFDNFVPERIREETRMVFMALMAEEIEPVEYHENPILAKNGEERIIAFHNTILRDETGKATATLSSGEDITEQRRAEFALRESENKFRDLAEKSVVGIYLVQDGVVKYCNPRLAEILGYAPEELVGREMGDFILAEDQPIVEENVRKRISGELRSAHYVFRALRKNGDAIWVEVYGSLTTYEGHPAVIGTALDITERKLMEQALYLSEEKFRTMIEYSNDMIWTLDIDGNVAFLNHRCEEVSGCQLSDFRGEAFITLVEEEYLPWVKEAFRRTLEGEPQHYEVGIRKRSGDILIVSVNSAPIFVNGEIVGTVSFGRDITTQRRAEQLLQASKEKYRTMIEQSNDMIWTLDREGKFTFFNKCAEEIGGCRLEDWQARDFSPLIVEEDLPVAIEAFRRTLNGDPSHYEVRVRKPDGGILILSVNTAPIFKDQEVVGTVSFGRDVTKLKRAQEELENSAKEWQQTFDAALDVIALISPEFKLLRVNRAGCESLGKTEEELIGKKCYEAVHGLDHPIDGCSCVQTLEAKEAGSGEIMDRGRYYIATTSPVLDQNGGLVAFAHTIKDITERKKAEQALAESELKFRNLAEQSPNMVFVNQRGLVVYANKCCEEIMGYTREELCAPDFDFMTLTAPDSRDLVSGACQKQLRGEDVPAFECTLLTKDGRRLAAIFTMKIIEYEGEHAVLGTIADITEQKRMEQELQESLGKLRKILGATIEVVALTVETKDPYTAGHQRRVTNLARAIATEMGLSQDQIEGIRVAGVIHDIGKISIPGEILSKPGRINEAEMGLIRSHPQTGYDILKTVEFPWPIAQIVLQHHERLDGTGYPLALSGEDILLEARILAVADVVEAMASHRPYRPALGIDEALEEISKNKGILYDPDAVDACVRLFTERNFSFDEGAKQQLIHAIR